MSKERLDELLEQVHGELDRGGPVDGETRELLGKVLADIREALHRPERAAPEEHGSLVDRLQRATADLEDSHPKLTWAIGQFIDVFSRPFR